MSAKPESTQPTPEAELQSWIDRLDPKGQKLFRSVRAAVRKRFPTVDELAYDYTSSIVLSYTPTKHGKDGIVSIAARADGVRLYLLDGPRLPDPKKLLQGSATQVRFVPVEAASRLAHPDVEALISSAIDRSKVAPPSVGKGRLIIQSRADKKPARRKPTK
jgi:hypothetical protein